MKRLILQSSIYVSTLYLFSMTGAFASGFNLYLEKLSRFVCFTLEIKFINFTNNEISNITEV